MSGEADVCAVGHPGSQSQFLAPDTDLQDLKGFFSRPVLITRGNITTSVGNLYTLAMTWNSFITEIPLWAERLRGVRGVRADLVFTVEHNANPFHQGLLVAAYQYGEGQFLRGSRPSMCTHLPHVRLNLSEHTSATLRVPYLSELEYWGSSLSEDVHVNGRFFLTQVLGTPNLAGSATPNYKVYLHLENIELFGRVPLVTPSSITPQSGVGSQPRGMDSAAKELANNGKLSGAIATAAMLPKAIGRAYPSIAPFMGSVSWFINATAKAASAFGFSKPVISKEPLHTVRYPNFCEANCDVPISASTVGAFQTNQVALSPALGGTDLDEMAFDTILTRPSQIFRGTMTTADSHGVTEYVSKVCLSHMWFRAPTGVVAPNAPGNIEFPASSTEAAALIPSTLLYFGQNFRFWHGGFKYRVTFAKSKFHTGRVMFTFIPNYRQILNTQQASGLAASSVLAPALFNADLQPSQYTTVFDLKSGSEFEFDIPYIAPLSHLAFNDHMGDVSMQVMDPLIANGESSTSISFIIEVAALPGFYFAGLQTPLAPSWVDQTDPVITFQSGLASPVRSNQDESPIEFQSGVGGSAVDSSQLSVGEKFSSLKQLMMCAITRRADIANNVSHFGIIPHWACAPGWGSGAVLGTNVTRTWALPRSGMVAQCYAYGIGSTLLHTDTTSLGQASAVRVYPSFADGNFGVVGTNFPSVYTTNAASPSLPWSTAYRGTTGAHFLLPSLSTAPRYRLGDFNIGGTQGLRDWAPSATIETNTTSSQSMKTLYRVAIRNNDGTNRAYYWGVSAADDARCAAYIGPCPMVLGNPLSTQNTWWFASFF